MGSERGDTSLEGSLRMEGWRGGAEEEEDEQQSWFPQQFNKHPFPFEERPKAYISGAEVSLSEAAGDGFQTEKMK